MPTWSIVATHAKTGLQYTQDGSISRIESRQVLKSAKDKAGVLLMVVHGQECYSNDKEGADVPDEYALAELIQ